MANTTPRLGLYKPESGENINVTTDLNNNLDKLDTNSNFRVVANETARLAISPVFEGLSVRETDSGRCYVSNGSSPASGSWEEILIITSSGIDLTDGGNFSYTGSSTGTYGFLAEVEGDTFHRFSIAADGDLRWGDGTLANGTDTRLYRTAANALQTDGDLTVDGQLTVGGVGFPNIIAKTVATTRANTTTMADDPELTTTLDANSTYLIEIHLGYAGPDPGKIKTQWTVPTNAVGTKFVIGPGSNSSDISMDNVNGRYGSHQYATNVVYGVRTGEPTFESAAIETSIMTTVDAGTLALAWAQETASATASLVSGSSWMRVTKLA